MCLPSSPTRGLGPAHSLPPAARRPLESRFGHDFSQVRIHDGPHAASAAHALGARAYTVGSHIVFGAGEYRPATAAGRRLLTHELTHVAQGNGGGHPSSVEAVGGANSPAEREAATVASRVAADRPAPPITARVCPAVAWRQPAAPAPEPLATWSPALPGIFSIMVESPNVRPGLPFGRSDSGRGLEPLSAQGQIEHFCSTPAKYPIQIRFFTDAVNVPRPQPFAGPELSVGLDFIPDGGTAPTFSRWVSDPAPGYGGPGDHLVPKFGTHFTIGASGSGRLDAHLVLFDSAHQVRVTYSDSIRCQLVPCV